MQHVREDEIHGGVHQSRLILLYKERRCTNQRNSIVQGQEMYEIQLVNKEERYEKEDLNETKSNPKSTTVN